ncbi:MAG: GGDEF domain-containing protein [Alphaproteobacteria bacterium]|nr:GGDEF domain-containing protein [Alphaproteobacteria bacterium]
MFELVSDFGEPANDEPVRLQRLVDRLRQDVTRGIGEEDGLPPSIAERLSALAEAVQSHVRTQAEEIARLKALALCDPLTGLLNRRGFEDALTRALAASRRHGERGLLAVLDLDGFKAVNDTHGHAAGDAILCAVARQLKAPIRATDFAARLGGDEFAVLFVNCSPEGAEARIQAIQRTLAAISLPWVSGPLTVRASLGVAAYGPQSEAGELFATADRAMYAEKRRARVEWLRQPA